MTKIPTSIDLRASKSRDSILVQVMQWQERLSKTKGMLHRNLERCGRVVECRG